MENISKCTEFKEFRVNYRFSHHQVKLIMCYNKQCKKGASPCGWNEIETSSLNHISA